MLKAQMLSIVFFNLLSVLAFLFIFWKKLKDDFQLTFYALAAANVKNEIFKQSAEEVILTLYYIEQDKKLSTTRSKEELEIARDKIITKAEEIQHSDFRCSGSIFCKNCEYNMICGTSVN